jgi:hypothetical protein
MDHFFYKLDDYNVIDKYKLVIDDNVNIYYACPGKSLHYDDYNLTLQHYDIILKANGEEPWAILFDGTNLTLKQSFKITNAMNITKHIINLYGKYLQKIFVIHPTPQTHFMVTALKVCLPHHLKDQINMVV